MGLVTSDPELIRLVTELHRAVVEEKDAIDRDRSHSGDWYGDVTLADGTVLRDIQKADSVQLRISYDLDTGAQVRRRYDDLFLTADMLADLGVRYVIVGHSERRALFGETDEIVNKKVLAALEAGLNPIICVGESLAQREMGVTMELIALQVKSALAGVSAEQMRRCVIAYEPIWAIGTGKTATGEQAAEVCTYIRSLIRAQYGARIARSVTIQYGGSMKGSNAHELLSHEDIDGGLIGGASLDPKALMEIVHAANQE